ncbi:hypothetical protein QNH20_07495 [Neobacillus sp. WH10]|uniref:hypothetical protein n=1 Tax=Neobacillus sp. WH10 TaxID=3047873 RepID=UPI0024C1288B|nr:hypothetical protein [Neobacillus sp. WH10]WHY78968.1 hypothetical protein QNH20_07495 [Neobacillus sp. WH10]
MDKAIIFGIYNFISFHACKALLNRGVEVIGVQFGESDKSPFLEEKRLEVGRNANFSERSLSEWENRREEESAQTTLILSIYDLYMLNIETILQKEKITRAIIQFIKESKNNTNVAFILPIQMLSAEQDKAIGALLERAKGCGKNTQMFYLPAIYGPWQPPTFLFHQAILAAFQKSEILKDEREWTGDVLYVDDAIETIIKTIETDNPGGFILESGKKNYWAECAAYLQIDEKIPFVNRNESLQIGDQIDIVSVKKITPIADSISIQMEHVQRLYPNG